MRRALRTTRHVSLGRPGQPIGALDSKAINQRRFVYEEALPQRRPGRRFRCTGYG